jgi:uncharacterized protein DUF4412
MLHMTTNTTARIARALLLITSLADASAGALSAQGLSYDMSTTGTGPDRTGKMSTVSFSQAHGQFAGSYSRIDFTQSIAPAGMMSTGTYMITNATTNTVTEVDPAKREYTVIDLAELGKASSDMQAAMGGVAKTEIADVKVNVEDLGPGEPLEGYATHKYRLTQSYTMNITVMGRTMSTPSRSTTDLWIAPQLDDLMDPRSRPPTSPATGMMAELTTQVTAAYAKVKKGLPLKRVTTSEGARGRTTTVTMTITNVKETAISPSVFRVPAGYAKVEMMDAMGASAAAARARTPE